MNREQFDAQLAELEKKFQSNGPELQLTVRDNDLGLEGYVVVWNSAPGCRGPLGPCGKGGTRISPTVSLEEVKMLAQRMALKNAAAGLAMGGAKSGLKADPDAPDFEKRYRRFAQLVKPILLENGGIFGGFGFDIGARPEHPRWICDELKTLRCFTGKPLDLGGTDYDREGVAGLGVAVAAKTAADFYGAKTSATRSAIQGMGAMGAAVFRYLTELGMPVSFVSDPRLDGSFALPASPPAELSNALINQDFVSAKRAIEALGLKKLPLEDILYQEVEILLPCAVQDVIRIDNCDRVRAKYVVEGANGPCSAEAHRALFKKGVRVIPDFIANPGGIIAAYIELSSPVSVEENLKTRKKVEEAKTLTRKRIAENVGRMLELAESCNVDPVNAGRMMALRNL